MTPIENNTTFFASVSGFTKKVATRKLWKEKLWKNVMGNDSVFPATPRELSAARPYIRRRFLKVLQNYRMIRKRNEELKLKLRTNHLGLDRESEMAEAYKDVEQVWKLLERFGVIANDAPGFLSDRCHTFLDRYFADRSVLSEVFPVAATELELELAGA